MTEDRYIIEVKRLRSQMVAVAMRYLENNDDAEDITQDALLKLWAMREMLRESEVDRLAFTVLKHLCINELKKREYKKSNHAVSIDSVDVALDSDNPHEIEERERQLMVAVDKLPSKQRLLLQMRYIKGKDVRTISALTGSSENSINMALSRARQSVYKYLSAAVVVIVCLALIPIFWKDNATKEFIADVPVMVEKPTRKNDSQAGVKQLIQSQADSNGRAYVKHNNYNAAEGLKEETENKKIFADVQQYYQQVMLESYQQVMAEHNMESDFDALCAYANAQIEDLYNELIDSRSEEMTYKENTTNIYDDL